MQDRAKANHDLGKDAKIYHVLDNGSMVAIFLVTLHPTFSCYLSRYLTRIKKFSLNCPLEEKLLTFFTYFQAIISSKIKYNVHQI